MEYIRSHCRTVGKITLFVAVALSATVTLAQGGSGYVLTAYAEPSAVTN